MSTTSKPALPATLPVFTPTSSPAPVSTSAPLPTTTLPLTTVLLASLPATPALMPATSLVSPATADISNSIQAATLPVRAGTTILVAIVHYALLPVSLASGLALLPVPHAHRASISRDQPASATVAEWQLVAIPVFSVLLRVQPAYQPTTLTALRVLPSICWEVSADLTVPQVTILTVFFTIAYLVSLRVVHAVLRFCV